MVLPNSNCPFSSHSNSDASFDPNPNCRFRIPTTRMDCRCSAIHRRRHFCAGMHLVSGNFRTHALGYKDSQRRKRETERPLSGDALITSLAKYELSKELESVIRTLLASDPTKRPKDLNQLSVQLAQFSGNKKLIDSFSVAQDSFNGRLSTGIEPIQTRQRATGRTSPGNRDRRRHRQTFADIASDGALEKSFGRPCRKNQCRDGRRATSQKKSLETAGRGCRYAVVVRRRHRCLGDHGGPQIVQVAGSSCCNRTPTPDEEVSDADVTTTPIIDLAAMPPAQRPILLQDLVAEDSESLWETPTTGAPSRFLRRAPSAETDICVSSGRVCLTTRRPTNTSKSRAGIQFPGGSLGNSKWNGTGRSLPTDRFLTYDSRF